MINNCMTYMYRLLKRPEHKLERSKKAFYHLKLRRLAYFISFIFFLILLSSQVDFSFTKLFNGLPDMFHLIRRILRPNFAYAIDVLPVLFSTVKMAILSTTLGVIFAIPFALITAVNLSRFPFLSKALNLFFALLRTIPSLIWAAILVTIFSIGVFSGIFALTITGFLISLKLFREKIETIPENLLQAAEATGANKIQILKYSVFPSVFESLLMIYFLVLETNIRNATVLGFVGAGGIGQIMWRDLNHMRYDNIATIILILFLTILMIDLISLKVRNLFKKKSIWFSSIKTYRLRQYFKCFFFFAFLITLVFILLNQLAIDSDRLSLGIQQSKIMMSRMIRMDWSYTPNMIKGIKESLWIALFATFNGAWIALISSYFCAYNLSPLKGGTYLFKGLVNIFRTFPPIITAIIFFRGVGPGPLAGALALTVYTSGMLTKLYSESIETYNDDIKNALDITGAHPLAVYTRGIVPHSFSTFLSLVLYRLESNIRASTVLGVIGAGGVGTILSMNIMWRNWERVGLLILGMSLMIMLIDQLSSWIREIFC